MSIKCASLFANAKEFQSKVQIFAPNAQVRVRKRLKTFENIQKYSKIM